MYNTGWSLNKKIVLFHFGFNKKMEISWDFEAKQCVIAMGEKEGICCQHFSHFFNGDYFPRSYLLKRKHSFKSSAVDDISEQFASIASKINGNEWWIFPILCSAQIEDTQASIPKKITEQPTTGLS